MVRQSSWRTADLVGEICQRSWRSILSLATSIVYLGTPLASVPTWTLTAKSTRGFRQVAWRSGNGSEGRTCPAGGRIAGECPAISWTVQPRVLSAYIQVPHDDSRVLRRRVVLDEARRTGQTMTACRRRGRAHRVRRPTRTPTHDRICDRPRRPVQSEAQHSRDFPRCATTVRSPPAEHRSSTIALSPVVLRTSTRSSRDSLGGARPLSATAHHWQARRPCSRLRYIRQAFAR